MTGRCAARPHPKVVVVRHHGGKGAAEPLDEHRLLLLLLGGPSRPSFGLHRESASWSDFREAAHGRAKRPAVIQWPPLALCRLG